MASNIWQFLALIQYELLLFAGVFFLIGALDDLAVDLAWLWLKLTGRARTARVNRQELQLRPLSQPVAVFIPAWQEADVIFDTTRHLLRVWPQGDLRLYIGIYRNDPETLAAAISAAAGDVRLRLVIHDRDGPSTKADCLNRLYEAMRDDERRSAMRFSAVLFHDAEDMVDPAGLGLLDWAIGEGADFAQLPVEPLPQASRDWLGSLTAKNSPRPMVKRWSFEARSGRRCPRPAWAAAWRAARLSNWLIAAMKVSHLTRRRLPKTTNLVLLLLVKVAGAVLSERAARTISLSRHVLSSHRP